MFGFLKKPTDERYVPGSSDFLTGYEHIHRYFLAQKQSLGKRVLDLACGEGYGSSILAQNALHVTGIDICPKTIRQAQKKYRAQNLHFQVGSIEKLPLAGQHLFDLVVCFEAIEHISAQKELLQEVKRVLAPGGLFIASTPNKPVYSERGTRENPHHLKELTFEELDQLLAPVFQHRAYFGQKSYVASKIFPLQGSDKTQDLRMSMGKLVQEEELLPRYFLIFASRESLPPLSEKSFLTDISQREGHIKWEAT
jgi:ubiquinone/menaquinone biosynthesis C-methylase UbiE